MRISASAISTYTHYTAIILTQASWNSMYVTKYDYADADFLELFVRLCHMTVSSSENRRCRAIQGLAEYCDAPTPLRVTWSDIRQRKRARKKRFFEVRIFLLRLRSPTNCSRARCFWRLREGVSLSDFFRWISPQNLRWSHRVSRLGLPLWTSIRRILSNMQGGSWQNMVRLYLWLFNHNPHKHLWVFLPRRYGTLFSDDDLRSIKDKPLSLKLKYLRTNTTTNSYTLELE